MIDNVVWALICVLIGLALLIKSLFGITIPFMRAVIGGILLYIGISLMTGLGTKSFEKSKMYWFSRNTITVVPDIKSYNLAMAEGIIDLAQVAAAGVRQFNLSVTAGSCTVHIPSDMSVVITGDSALGGIQFPDEEVVNWGKKKYANKPRTIPTVTINAKAALGTVVFTYK